MSETGTARIMRLSVDPAGVGWTSGDALLDFDGRCLQKITCRRRAPIWYLAYICLAGRVSRSTSSRIAISRYQVAMVVGRWEKADLDLHAKSVSKGRKSKILTDAWNPTKVPPHPCNSAR